MSRLARRLDRTPPPDQRMDEAELARRAGDHRGALLSCKLPDGGCPQDLAGARQGAEEAAARDGAVARAMPGTARAGEPLS